MQTCSHGEAGWCWDDASPEQRVEHDSLHRHAFAWAVAQGIDRDTAEEYAGWFAVNNDSDTAHPNAWRHFPGRAAWENRPLGV